MRLTKPSLRALLRATFRTANIPAAIAVVVVIGAAIFAEAQNGEIFRQGLRTDVLARLSVIRTKLEGDIGGNIQLVKGLTAVVESEPDMDQARFADLAARLVTPDTQLRHIAGAPGMVVELIYPLQGNERAIGLNYALNERQRASALRARDTGDLVLAGPVDLVQGGKGIIGRFPVYSGSGSARSFWGIVSAVIDVDRLYRDAGLLDHDLKVDIAISGVDGRGTEVFFGQRHVFEDKPVMSTVALPGGYWRIAAIPRGGWDVPPPNLWILRTLMLFAGLLVICPMIFTSRLLAERHRQAVELRRRQFELTRLSRRLQLALESSSVGVWDLNIATGELVWDERMLALYGLPPDAGTPTVETWRAALHPEDREQAERDFDDAIRTAGAYKSDFRLLLADGSIRHLRSRGAVYAGEEGETRIAGVNIDVSADVALADDLKRAKTQTEQRNFDLVAAQARIEHTALHDSLTGLPNRRYLDELLEQRALEEQDERGLALLHVDLDRFKQINDTLGHAAGDAMLVHAAAVLRRNVRTEDFVARVGGDEFVIMCRTDGRDPVVDDESLAGLAQRIIAEMRHPVVFEGHECRFGVSIGIASQRSGEGDPRRLLVNADIALYRAKNRGRDRHQFFNEALQAEIVATKRVADEILQGIERNEFVAYFQPQVDAVTHKVVGAEALARWNHPRDGILGPDAFMRIAEELNVVATIDRMILEQALDWFARLEGAGTPIPKVSVNVSARRLRDDELIASLRQLDIRPGTLSFELVESIFLDENDDLVTWNIDQIKELGIDVEIDDFGTGYASIVSLLKLKPASLKIDRQLTQPITTSPAQVNLVASIIDIGKSLGISVLAEGVETMEQAALLRKLGCDRLQGFAFAAALSPEDFQHFVSTRDKRLAS